MALTFDAKKNFSYSVVAVAPSPATSGTSLQVAPGDGAKFPAVPFNAVIWPVSQQPTTTNAEVVRVTNIATDTLTITRTQESSSARTVIIGDQIAVNITAKALTDIEGSFVTAGQVTCPVGSVQMWLTNSAPTGWLLCDGSAVSRATYSELFALVSTTFGAGDGSTTFNLPDMRQRIPIGRHSGVTALDTIGETQGSWDHTHGSGSLAVASHTHGPGTLAVASHTHGPGTLQAASHSHGPGTFRTNVENIDHTHTMNNHTHSMQNHTHTFSGTTDAAGGGTNSIAGGVDTSSNFTNHTHGFSGTTSGPSSASTGTPSNNNTGTAGGSHDHAVSTGVSATTAPLVDAGATAAASPAVNAGVTAGTAPAVSSGTTDTANPPVLVLNFIVRATSTI